MKSSRQEIFSVMLPCQHTSSRHLPVYFNQLLEREISSVFVSVLCLCHLHPRDRHGMLLSKIACALWLSYWILKQLHTFLFQTSGHFDLLTAALSESGLDGLADEFGEEDYGLFTPTANQAQVCIQFFFPIMLLQNGNMISHTACSLIGMYTVMAAAIPKPIISLIRPHMYTHTHTHTYFIQSWITYIYTCTLTGLLLGSVFREYAEKNLR